MEPSTLRIQIQRPDGAWVEVGHLHSADNRIWFDIQEEYWNLADRPILGQAFEEHGQAWTPSSRLALPTWFSHLLPEGRLRRAVASAAETDTKHEFDLLRRIGASDLPGATRAISVDYPANGWTPRVVNSEEGGTEDDPILKFSLAGAQLKFSVYGGSDGRGLTVPAQGQAGNYIVKFPDGRPGFLNVPEAELGCLELARAAGITAAHARLISPESVRGLEDWAAKSTGKALCVTRFDRRPDDTRIHMEEFAQIMEIPTANEFAKYHRSNFELVAVLAGGLCGHDTVGEIIDRIVLNVLVGNGDAHLKNWAILYQGGKTPTLSPLYDVLPTVLYIDNDNLGLKINKSRLFEDVRVESFRRIGERTGYGSARALQRAREAVGRIMDSWAALSQHVSREVFSRLTTRVESLPLVRP